MSEPENLKPAWLPAAEAVLQAALDSDLDKVGALMVTAMEDHGGAVPGGFAIAWIDTLRQHIGVPVGSQVHTHHRHVDPGTECRTTPPGVVWAGKLIAARIARDQKTYEALWAEAAEVDEFGERLIELLLVVAQTINVSATEPVARRRPTHSGHRAHTHGFGDVRPPV